jgi:hypothetical protein
MLQQMCKYVEHLEKKTLKIDHSNKSDINKDSGGGNALPISINT